MQPGVKFPKGKRKPLMMSCSPGPKYQTRKPLTDQGKIQMTIKNRYRDFLKIFKKGTEVPGPGRYNIREKILNPQKGRTIYRTGRAGKTGRNMGERKADEKLKNQKKGILRSDSNTVCLDERSASLPGPGSYNIRREFGDVRRGVGFARASRYVKGSLFGSDSVDELERMVGPGTYKL